MLYLTKKSKSRFCDYYPFISETSAISNKLRGEIRLYHKHDTIKYIYSLSFALSFFIILGKYETTASSAMPSNIFWISPSPPVAASRPI